MKSGKYCLGYKQTLKTLRQGKAKLIIIANNTPHLRYSSEIYWEVVLPHNSSSTWHHMESLARLRSMCCGRGRGQEPMEWSRQRTSMMSKQLPLLVYGLAPCQQFHSPLTLLISSTESPRLSTTLCWPRLESITTTVTILSWEPLAVNTSAYAPSPSPTPVIQTSFALCQRLSKTKQNCQLFVC